MLKPCGTRLTDKRGMRVGSLRQLGSRYADVFLLLEHLEEIQVNGDLRRSKTRWLQVIKSASSLLYSRL